MRIAVKFAYDGRNFHGYARQPKMETIEGNIINILIKIEIQDRAMLFRTVIMIFLLSLLFILDREIIIQMIPHNLAI